MEDFLERHEDLIIILAIIPGAYLAALVVPKSLYLFVGIPLLTIQLVAAILLFIYVFKYKL